MKAEKENEQEKANGIDKVKKQKSNVAKIGVAPVSK
jgi:hypothetical protein